MKDNLIFMNYPDMQLPVKFGHSRMEMTENGFQRLAGFWKGTSFLCTGWRFYYNDTAGGSIQTGEKWYELIPENIYLLPPGCEFTTGIKNNPHQFYMHFTLSHYPGFLRDPLFILSLDNISQELMLQAINKPSRGYLACSKLIFHTLSRLPESVFEGGVMDKRVTETIRYMGYRLNEDLSIAHLAQKEDLSEGAFSRLFRKETGQSPYAFLIGMRIEQASHLLRTSGKTIEEIAFLCGFRDRFHFSRTFKRQTNRNPGEFRRI